MDVDNMVETIEGEYWNRNVLENRIEQIKEEGDDKDEKSFFETWSDGIKAITPLQMTKVNLFGLFIILVGIIIGLYMTFKTKMWWLVVILSGSLIVSLSSFVGTYRNYLNLIGFYKVVGGNNE